MRVERSGFKPLEQQDVRVRLGQRVELDYTLSLGARQELVDVTAAAPVVDTRSTTAGGVLDSDELLRLPVGRRLTATLYMVPGVSSSSGTGDANPSIAGASGLDNQYVVDGVNITNAGFGGIGVYTVVFGSLGTGVTTDFIQETQVKTAGFEAEYGQATGGVVNVITRSGSNAFHGSLYGYLRPSGLEGAWRQQQTENGQVNTTRSQDLDVGISVGGPLLKDRLFFFGAFNPQYETRTLIAPEGFPLRSLGEVDRKRRSLSYAGKLTWQLKAQRFDLSAFGDPSHGEPGPQRPDALLAADTDPFSELRRYGSHSEALRYSGVLGPKWWLEVTAAQARTRHEELPTVDVRSVTDFSVVPIARSGGLGTYPAGTVGRNAQLALKSTHLLGGGAHELRYGIQLEDIEWSAPRNRTGPSFTFPDGTGSRTGVVVTVRSDPVYGRIYTADGSVGEPPVTTQDYLSWFAQDTWRVGPRLTLRPGIRWERQRHRRRPAAVPLGRVVRWSGRRHPGQRDQLRLHLDEQLGPSPGRHLRRRRLGPVEALRELGALLREDPQRPRGPRHGVGADSVGGLFRRGSRPARARRRPGHSHDRPLPHLERPPVAVRERLTIDVLRRVPGRLRDRGGAGPEPGRALRPPPPGPCARGLLPGAAGPYYLDFQGAR